MAYDLEEIKYSQKIFYYLLENKELSENKERELYKQYVESEEVMNLVKFQSESANCNIVRYGSVIYLIPKEDNTFLGYSKNLLKLSLCRSGATDKDYYLSQFVVLTLLVEFYDGHGSTGKVRDFIRAGELLNIIRERLREGTERETEEEEKEKGLAFSNMLEAFQALRSEEKGSKAKTTKEGFLYTILNFLQKQGLIEYIDADELIKPTDKLDRFMDWNLLNRNNYHRVLRALGIESDIGAETVYE